jgi:hypothetical protein
MAPDLSCGAATVDITPWDRVPGIRLAGFESDRRATAVLDPLEAGCVWLSAGAAAVALVTADSIGLQRPLVERVRDRLAGRIPDGTTVLVCSTHSHEAPDTMGLWGRALLGAVPLTSGVDPVYLEAVVDRLVSLVIAAFRAAGPASVRAARFDVPADWCRNDRKGGGKDDTGLVLAFDAPDGRRIATLANFAAHPETLWEGNTLVSADFPGAFRRRVREATPGVPLYFSGALGGMVTPNVPLAAGLEARKAYKDRLGRDLADAALAALEGVPALADTTLAVRTFPLAVPLDNGRFRLMRAIGILERETLLGRIKSEMNLVRIGPDVSILTAPGECTPELGHELVEGLPGRVRMVFCLGCDELGYVLTPAQSLDPEYRYEQTMTPGPRTGPLFVDALRRLVRDPGGRGGVES